MASHAQSPELTDPLFALLDGNQAGDELRHQIVELCDTLNVTRLDKLLGDIEESAQGGLATISARLRLAGEEATTDLLKVRDHVASRRQ